MAFRGQEAVPSAAHKPRRGTGMSVRARVAVFSAVLLALAALVGLLPVSAAGASCGSGFSEDRMGQVSAQFGADLRGSSGDVYAECEDARGSRQTWVWVLGIAGLLVAVGAALTPARTTPGTSASR
jgi:hypothetical protein